MYCQRLMRTISEMELGYSKQNTESVQAVQTWADQAPLTRLLVIAIVAGVVLAVLVGVSLV